LAGAFGRGVPGGGGAGAAPIGGFGAPSGGFFAKSFEKIEAMLVGSLFLFIRMGSSHYWKSFATKSCSPQRVK
jgi:hypothetical protein